MLVEVAIEVIELERIAAKAMDMCYFGGVLFNFLETLRVTGKKKAVEAVLLVKEPMPVVPSETIQNKRFGPSSRT